MVKIPEGMSEAEAVDMLLRETPPGEFDERPSDPRGVWYGIGLAAAVWAIILGVLWAI
jgi:hypothetical protein